MQRRSLSLFGDKDDIVGVDIDKNRLEITKKFEKVIYAGAEDLPFENETFDSVVALEVIEHVKKREHALCEMIRVLKRGGTLIISFPIEPFKGYPAYLSKQNFQKMIQEIGALEILHLDYLPLSLPIMPSFDGERDMPKFRKKWYFRIFLLFRPLLRWYSQFGPRFKGKISSLS